MSRGTISTQLKPVHTDDIKRMLGEKDILIEQLTQAILELEAKLAQVAKPVEEEPAS